jgi:molybdopterin synthase sulfur carrier subunit
MSVTLRYWAAAKEAAGLAEEEFDTAATLSDLVRQALSRHPDDGRLAQVLSGCAFVIDDAPVGRRPHDGVTLPPGAVVEVLPPFAGG